MNLNEILKRGLTGFNGLFAPTQAVGMGAPGMTIPGINGNVNVPQSAPMAQQQSPMDSPAMQIGLRMLLNSSRRPGGAQGLGGIVGSSVLGYQQDSREQQLQKLQADMLKKRMEEMSQPQGAAQDPAQLALLKALQSDPKLMETYKQTIGAGGAAAMPSALQEWEAFQKMTPEQQKQYLNMKRQPAAPQLSIINGVPTLVDRINNTTAPLSNLESEAAAQGTLAAGKAAGQARGEALGGQEKKGIQAGSTLATLDLAEPLIDAATGSLAGAGADKLAAVFGEAPKGAQAIAQLKVLQANLMTSMPRMEGPQSDKDVALYREAAGQIGDPTIPKAIKKAAVNTIRQINERYQKSAPSAGASPTSKVRRYNPATETIE